MKNRLTWMVGWVSGVACLTGLVTGMGFSNTAATAQEGGCLMITSSGKRINLTKLCGVPSGVTQSGQPGVHVARIKRREGGTPVIDVVFNGSRSFEMLLDTGASGTLITESMAIALRIPIVTTGRFTVADGRTVVFPIGQVRSMSIDGAESRNVLVAIAPNTATGLLGQNFFGQYDIKIKRDVIEFYRR